MSNSVYCSLWLMALTTRIVMDELLEFVVREGWIVGGLDKIILLACP